MTPSHPSEVPSLKEIELPKIEIPDGPPVIPPDEYRERIDHLIRAIKAPGFDALVVYGDREHFANLRYLCGFDPRFEEAILILRPDSIPSLLLGNEGWDYSKVVSIEVNRLLAQTLSLPGQDRTKTPRLDKVLQDAGLSSGQSIGIIGWKVFSQTEIPPGFPLLAAPDFLVQSVRSAVGETGTMRDATDLLIGLDEGARLRSSPTAVAEFEYGASLSSANVLRAIQSVEPGMTELELAQYMGLNAYPLSCHPLVVSGREEFVNIRSPTARSIRRGDMLFVVVGVWGGLTARAGIVAESEAELTGELESYVAKFASAYYVLTKCWYETVKIGATGGEVARAIEEKEETAPFRLALNPGHYTHYDEWVHSSFSDDDNRPLQNGSLLQCDMIPVGSKPVLTCNVEDTLCLGDEEFRSKLFEAYPDVAERVGMRRKLMEEQLGIYPSADVIPLSNIQAFLPPLLMRPNLGLSFRTSE